MKTSHLRKTTSGITILALLPHLFCCVIPIVAALIALGSTVGLGAALVSNPFYAFVDQYHIPLLTIAVIGVTLSGILNVIAYRIDCRDAACTHGSCKPKKLKSFRIFLISLFLLVLDVSWFMAERHWLGLHDHHGHAHGNHAGEQHTEHTDHTHHDHHAD